MRDVSLAVCLCVMLVCRAAAQEAGPSHVRSESRDVQRMIAEAQTRSATFRALVDTLDRSDVIVYVRLRPFASRTLEGRVGILGWRAGTRYLAIELACPRIRDTQMATLAHELQHATEIARARWVIDATTLARYYAQIGDQISADRNAATFETVEARAVGERVRHELAGPAVVTAER